MAEHGLLALRHMTHPRQFPELIDATAKKCHSEQDTECVLILLTNPRNKDPPLIHLYIQFLKQCETEVLAAKVSEYSISALMLLKRLFKYSSFGKLEKFIACFDVSDPVGTLIAFLWNFLPSPNFARYAAACLEVMARYYPKEILVFVGDLSKRYAVSDYMNRTSSVVPHFARIATSLTRNAFTVGSNFSSVPDFASFIVKEYFTTAVLQKYEKKTHRWKTLTALIETAYNVCIIDKTICSSIQNDTGFCRSLVSVVLSSAEIIQDKKQSEDEDEKTVMKAVIQFATGAIGLLIYLVEFNLQEKELAYLEKSFFDEKSRSCTLFSTLVSFLEVKDPLTALIRERTMKLLELMCDVAGKMADVNVDSFYSQRQDVLIESIRANLFEGDHPEIELDFMAKALLSQTSFAYTFIRQIGVSFITAASPKMLDIARQAPDIFLSLARLLSRIFRSLSSRAKVVERISNQADFWKNVNDILMQRFDNANCIAGQAYLIHCMIIGSQQVRPAVISNILKEVNAALPDPRPPLTIDYIVDFNMFKQVGKRPYGEHFYLDDELLDAYFLNKDTEIVEFVKILNKDLSMIDACTQLLAAILAELRTSKNYGAISVDDALQVVHSAIINERFPASSADIIFEILSFTLDKEGSSHVSTSHVEGLERILKDRPTDAAFRVVARLFAASHVEPVQRMMISMIESCIQYAKDNESKNALDCATEIALKLVDDDGWVQNSELLIGSFISFLPTKLGPEIVNLFTVICENTENAMYLDTIGWFECIMDPRFTEKDSIWMNLFNFMTIIPPQSIIACEFLKQNLTKIQWFMSPQAVDALPEEQIYRIQLTITDLMLHATQHHTDFFISDPAIFEKLQDILVMKLEQVVKYMKLRHYVTVSGTIGIISSYSPKLCNFVMLRNCLMFMSNGFEQKLEPSSSMKLPEKLEETTEKIMEDIQAMISQTEEKYALVMIQAFDFALRLFSGAIYRLGRDKLFQVRENRDSVLRSIKKMSDNLKKFPTIDTSESKEFYDDVSDFLSRLF